MEVARALSRLDPCVIVPSAGGIHATNPNVGSWTANVANAGCTDVPYMSRRLVLDMLGPSTTIEQVTSQAIQHQDRTHGHDLLSRLTRSAFTIIIAFGSYNECDATYKNGRKTGSTVRWNPSYVGNMPGPGPFEVPCPPFIALGHELIHAEQLTRGIVRVSDFHPARRVRSFSMRVEWFAIRGYFTRIDRDDRPTPGRPRGITENQLRSDHRIVDRTGY